MSNSENIAHTVRTYLDLVGKGSAEDVVMLYSEDATVEDPVGGEVHCGIEAIRSFYRSVVNGQQIAIDLLSLNVAGGEAAFHFRVIMDDHRLDVIDVMTFDDQAKITTMKAYWGPANLSS